MNIRKFLSFALILTAVLLLTATGVVAANSLRHGRGPTNWQAEDNFEDSFMGGPMHGFGWSATQESDFTTLQSLMIEEVAEVSDLTKEEIEARINSGEHLFTIAVDAGVSQEDFYQMMFEVRRSFSGGVIEQGQFSDGYQWMFDHMDEFQGQPFYGGCHGFYPSEFESNYQRDGRGD